MASTNKTSLGLNMWEASDKPVRQDFINDNKIIDERIAKLNSDLVAYKNKLEVSNNLGTVVFSYDGNNTVFVDWNITTTNIMRIAFDNFSIRQLWTTDGGTTWTTIWTK